MNKYIMKQYNLEGKEYIIFLERNKIKSIFGSNKFINKIKTKFKKKCIEVIILNDLKDSRYYNYDGKKISYDNIDYPTFGKLYILFDTCNLKNIKHVNYYNINLYFFQMKSFVHNFLIFLAQSLGAHEISWKCTIENKQTNSRSLSGSLGAYGVQNKQEIKMENEKENKMTNDLKLEYDNNGTELFFSTMNNEISWGVKIYKIIQTSSVSSYDVIKYSRNDNILENFLENNRYFKYEFFMNNDFLIDFVRKRRNGMTSIHHEILFYDNHRSMFNYYNKLGVKYLGNLGFKYSNEITENNYDKTIYHVKFYNTKELEKVTLMNIVQEKTIKQLLLESDKIIEEICKKEIEQKDEETEFEVVGIIKNEEETKEEKEENEKKEKEEKEENEKKEKLYVKNKKRNSIYVILQKYKYYFGYLENRNETLDIQKIRFLKNTLKEDDKLENEELNYYFSKIQDDFLLLIVNDILESIDMEERYETLIVDIKNLTSSIDEKNNFPEIEFIKNSNFYIDNDTINSILNKIPKYESYKNIKEQENEKKLYKKYKNITKIELVNKANGNNYAACDGVYIIDENQLINEQGVFINKKKNRFIANCNGGWILTSTEYLKAIIEESVGKTDHYFGGFHASISTDAPIALSKWKEYDVNIKN